MDDIDIIPRTMSAWALRGATLGGLGVALNATRGARAQDALAAGTSADDKILTFALNFEYLGAELYRRALTGSGLDAADIGGVGTPGPVRGGRPLVFSTDVVRDVVGKLAEDELAHVRKARARLGSVAVAQPAINLTVEWSTAIAIVAGAIEQGRRFDPYADEIAFLKAAYVLGDVRVTGLAEALPPFHPPRRRRRRVRLPRRRAGTVQRHPRHRRDLGAAGEAVRRAGRSPHHHRRGNRQLRVQQQGQVLARTPTQVVAVAYGGGTSSDHGFFPIE